MTKEQAIKQLKNSLAGWYEYCGDISRYISDDDFEAIECLIQFAQNTK